MGVQTEPGVTEVWADGSKFETALPRLEYAVDLIVRRRSSVRSEAGARYIGEAFRVHLIGNVGALVVDEDSRRALETCALYGEKYGVVVLAHTASREAAVEAFRRSAPLTDALDLGRSVRYVEGRAAVDIAGPQTGAAAAADALLAAARLVVGQTPLDLYAALDRALGADSASARDALALALHTCADMIAPAADGDEQ